MSTAWVTSLRKGTLENLAIAKEAGKWGTAHSHARNVVAGDELFIARGGGGWRAWMIALSDAYPAPSDMPPWPDRNKYRWIFEIAFMGELEFDRVLKSKGGVQGITGIPTVKISQFQSIEPAQGDVLRTFFAPPSAFQEAPVVPAVEPTGGWGRGPDRDRNKKIEQAGINVAYRYFLDRGYTMSRDCQLLGVGYDLEFSRGEETLHVEVKGIAGPEMDFNLTVKEYRVSREDPMFRLVAVTFALTEPLVQELTGPELHSLVVSPSQYRVRANASRDVRAGAEKPSF